MKLNLGCGNKKMDGFINADICKAVKPDIMFDMNESWPFEDEVFDYILASQVFEHTIDIVFVMKEAWRILRVGGIIEINCTFAGHPSVSNQTTTIFCDQGISHCLRESIDMMFIATVQLILSSRWFPFPVCMAIPSSYSRYGWPERLWNAC